MKILGELFPAFAEDAFAAEAAVLRRLVGGCPVCGDDDLAGHYYAEIATAVIETEGGAKPLLEMAERGEWVELRGLTSVGNNRDNIRWVAIRCYDGAISILTIVDPVELQMSEWVLAETAVTTEAEMTRVNEALSTTLWKPLPAGKANQTPGDAGIYFALFL